MPIYIQLQRDNKNVSKIQDIARNAFEKCWLFQIYCSHRYRIIVVIVNTIFSWQRKRWWDSLYMERLCRQSFWTILRTHSSISMIIDVNGFYGKDVINVEGGLTWTSKHQINIKRALLSILVARREVYSL